MQNITNKQIENIENTKRENDIGSIKLPAGYEKIIAPAKSFHSYLTSIKLKTDKTVYLFDGSRKANQSAQYAVLDISVGNKDLQQCADAVMRLRAEYFYEQKKYGEIEFYNGRREKINYMQWLGSRQNTREMFMKYMQHVFNYCGTASLPYSVKNKSLQAMQPGDILLKPGSPGHTVMVMDMAKNSDGKRIYLLAQSYMPAQDIHVLQNPMNPTLSPWYQLNDEKAIDTPEWNFYSNQLYGWK